MIIARLVDQHYAFGFLSLVLYRGWTNESKNDKSCSICRLRERSMFLCTCALGSGYRNILHMSASSPFVLFVVVVALLKRRKCSETRGFPCPLCVEAFNVTLLLFLLVASPDSHIFYPRNNTQVCIKHSMQYQQGGFPSIPYSPERSQSTVPANRLWWYNIPKLCIPQQLGIAIMKDAQSFRGPRVTSRALVAT